MGSQNNMINLLSIINLLLMMYPSLPRKMHGDTQRNARHTNKQDIRKVSAEDIMRQGERK